MLFEKGKLNLPEINHFGFIVPNAKEAIKKAAEDFGVKSWTLDYKIGEGVKAYYKDEELECVLNVAFTSIGGIRVEFVEPVSGNGIHQKFLEQSGGGIHHYGYLCDSTEEYIRNCEYLKSLGYEEVHRCEALCPAGDGRSAFFDVRSALGVILEVTEPISIFPEHDEIYEG